MPKISKVGREARDQVVKGAAKGYPARQAYREAISGLEDDDDTIELAPEEGETLRGVMMNLAWAAREVGISDLKWRKTINNTVVAWRESGYTRQKKETTPSSGNGRRRGRPRKEPVEDVAI